MSNDNPAAVAWMLTSPSASGGKVYQVLLAENILVVGWGSMQSPTKQYKISAHPNPTAARRAAVTQTAEKEAKGYALSVPPRTLPIGSGKMETLRSLVGQRGANSFLQASLSKILTAGQTLAA